MTEKTGVNQKIEKDAMIESDCFWSDYFPRGVTDTTPVADLISDVKYPVPERSRKIVPGREAASSRAMIWRPCKFKVDKEKNSHWCMARAVGSEER